MTRCESGHVYDEAQHSLCPFCRLNRKLQWLMRKGWYSSAKNLADWYLSFSPEYRERDSSPGAVFAPNPFPEIVSAMCAWQLGDFCDAAGRFEVLRAVCADGDRQRMEQLLGLFAQMTPPVAIDCPHERLRGVLHRLSFVFSGIRWGVRVFVAGSEAEYLDFLRTCLPGVDCAYDSFLACGFSGGGLDPCWLVFRREILEGEHAFADNALLGLCAHEMAHLDLGSRGIPDAFQDFRVPDARPLWDQAVNERLTDLHVISKGLGCALWSARANDRKDDSGYVMTRQDIYSYICGIDAESGARA